VRDRLTLEREIRDLDLAVRLPSSDLALRQQIAQTAAQEWGRWGMGAKKETDVSMRSILKDYWIKAGISPQEAERRIDKRTPWSAAFISWVMNTAGAGPAFAYSTAHQGYIAAAKRNRVTNNQGNPFWAYPITEAAPEVGHIICACRKNSGATYDNIDKGFRKAHCDIVTEVRPRELIVIGGNVDSSVKRKKPIKTDDRGRVVSSGSCTYFAVIKVGNKEPGNGTAQGSSREPAHSLTTASLSRQPRIDLEEAVRVNRQLGQKLGWNRHVDQVVRLLGFANYSPDEQTFAEAVAQWQQSQNLTSDGIIGPNTWSRMQESLGSTQSSGLPSKPTPQPTTPAVEVHFVKDYEGGGKATRLFPFRPAGDPRDIIVGATAEAEGGYDTVNMYDRGILSWGIMQWTLHAGSLQMALAFIKRRLVEIGRGSLWSELFPHLDVMDDKLIYRRTPVIGEAQLRRLFRGYSEPGRYDKATIQGWATKFSRAGRHPIIQQLQQEYARTKVDDVLNIDLGKALGSFKQGVCQQKNKKAPWTWICNELPHPPDFYRANYGLIRRYVYIKDDLRAATLLFGVWINNPAVTYVYLRRAVDNLAQRNGTHDTGRWGSTWQTELGAEFERLLRASRFGYWGDEKAKAAKRLSRTAKILKAFNSLSARGR
jgi:hypothetical protein